MLHNDHSLTHYIGAGVDLQYLIQSFPVFFSDAHSDHASSVFIKTIARLLFHNKLNFVYRKCYACCSIRFNR